MEIDEIKAEIEEADRKKAALLAELEAHKAVARQEFLIRLRADLSALGMTIEDIVGTVPSKPAAKKTRKPRQARALKSDPSKVYLSGALPEWLKGAMVREGLAPSDKEARKAFLDQYMQAVA